MFKIILIEQNLQITESIIYLIKPTLNTVATFYWKMELCKLFGHVNFKYSSNKLYSVEKWKCINVSL